MFRVKVLVPGLLGLALLLLTACGGGAAPPTSAPAAATIAPLPTTASATVAPVDTPDGSGGQAIFTGAGGCVACHTIEGVPGAAGKLGPDLTHIGTDAANRKPGTDARDYIFESIRDPEAFVATGVERANPGLMTRAITAGLSDDQVEQLTDFLLEQK